MVKIQVYVDDGRVFEYNVLDMEKVREHTHAIIMTGYRHCTENTFEHYPPQRILKVKVEGDVGTKFPDIVRGT